MTIDFRCMFLLYRITMYVVDMLLLYVSYDYACRRGVCPARSLSTCHTVFKNFK